MDRMEKFASQVFNKRKEDSVKWANKVSLRKTAGKPKQGPYYWVYLNPNWVLKSVPVEGNAETVDHVNFWRNVISPLMSTHYKANERDINDLPYSMPRGRVQVLPDRQGRQTWVIYHGLDFLMTDSMKKQVLEQFDLSAQWRAGLVRFVPDDHEIVMQDDFESIKSLIRLPSKEDKKIKLIEPNFE